MEPVNYKKLYMLLELEKIKHKSKDLHNLFPFPTKMLEFDSILLRNNKKYQFTMQKVCVDEEWILTSKQPLNLPEFNERGEFRFRHREAFEVLKELHSTNLFALDIQKEVHTIASNDNRWIVQLMCKYNNLKNEVEDEALKKVNFIKNKHKEKKSHLMEDLCEFQKKTA